jgi:hypothetical protein
MKRSFDKWSFTTINIDMLPSNQLLSEMVVIGYGVQKKSDLTGSVAMISAEDIQCFSRYRCGRSHAG